jgi:hypothetical protein
LRVLQWHTISRGLRWGRFAFSTVTTSGQRPEDTWRSGNQCPVAPRPWASRGASLKTWKPCALHYVITDVTPDFYETTTPSWFL